MIATLHSCILALVVIFNVSGIYLLKLTNSSGSCNQRMILMSLSSCNIVISFLWVGDMISIHFKATETKFYYRWWPFLAGTYIVWYAMILLLTIDRFIGCNFPIKHMMFVRKSVISGAIFVCWLIGLVLAVVGCLFGSSTLRPGARQYLWPSLDILFMLLFVATYGSIFRVLARRRFRISTSNQTSDQSQFIVTVTALLFCFLALEAIPSIIFVFLKSPSTTYVKLQSTIYKINLLCDPLIYVFLQQKVRAIAKQKFRTICSLIFWRKFHQQIDLERQRDLSLGQEAK